MKMIAGQKVEIEVTLVDFQHRAIMDKHGWVNSHVCDITFKGTDGTTYTFHTTSANTGLYGVKVGDTFKMKATVKEVADTEIKLIRCRKA